MKYQSTPLVNKTEKANPLMKAAILAAVILALLPAVIYGAITWNASDDEVKK